METIVKHFNELSTKELFEIYQLRVAVFVVEQTCPYQEVDEYDLDCYHMMVKEGGKLIAYLRILPPHATFESVAIGRVICIQRRQGIATKLLKEAIEVAKQKYQADLITIEAQVYARKLYENVGFVQTSEEFLEDGIPHIQMQLHI